MMEEEEETELSRVDSWLQSLVPSLPKFFACICLVFNIIVPGLGTFLGGFMSCCCGRPRIDFRPAKYRCPVALMVMILGVMQLVSSAFFLVGWLWSIIWGFLMVNLSGEEFRRMPVPPVEEDKKAPKVPSIQIDDSHSTGKKNFSRLVVKANENKELASAGELIQSPVDTSPKLTPLSTNGVQDENAFNKEKDASSLSASETKTKDDDDISSNGKATPNSLANSDSLTSIAVNSSKPSSAAIFKNSASASSLHSMELKSAQKNTRSRISPFKCFHSNEKKFISDKIGKFITGFLSESRNNLLSDDVETGRTNTDDRNLLTASARRIFRDWRDRAHKMAARHVIPEKISYLRTKTPLTNNVTHQPSSTHSLASILPNSSSSSTSGEKQQLPSDNVHIHSEEFNRDRLLLNPSKLLDVKPKLNTRKFSVSKLNTDKSRRLNSDLSPTKLSEMKPRLTQSTTYHFEAE